MDYSVNKSEILFVNNDIKDISDNKCNNLTMNVLARQYSSFVFLVSMKYLKDEEKSKDAVLDIFKRLNKLIHKIDIQNIKEWLYQETKFFCTQDNFK